LLGRVGNFRQKNDSAEDGIDGTNDFSDGIPEQKTLEFCSEYFHGRENISKFRGTKIEANSLNSVPTLPWKRKQLVTPLRGTKINNLEQNTQPKVSK
jgi:hypothetical protein